MKIGNAGLLASVALCINLVSMPSHATEVGGVVASVPSGNGYTSLDLCTRTNVSADNFNRVRDYYTAPKVAPLPSVWYITNKPGVSVTTAAAWFLFPKTAAYRSGLGCTMVKNSADERTLRAQKFKAQPDLPLSSAPWPHGEGAAEIGLLTPAQSSVINAHADAIFTETTSVANKRSNTYALLLAKDGHLVYERYAAGYNREQRQIGWSMTKSLTAILAGVMAKDGLISLDAPVEVKSWLGSNKAGITWRHLLNMASGLQWDESGATTPNDVYEMLFNNYDDAGYAAGKPLAYQPGTHFTYSTGAQTIAMAVMKDKLGGSHQAIYDYYQQRLFAPLGIRNGLVEPDFTGTPIGGARGVLRPIDWMRLGQLVVNGGTWKGQQLLPPVWASFLRSPSPANPEYAGSMWTKYASDVPPALRDRVPDDTVYFLGLLGQFVVMVPSHNLILVRMGVTFDPDRTHQEVFSTLADLIEQGL